MSQAIADFSLLDVLTLAIAVWGALLSTYLALRELRKERPQLHVRSALEIRENEAEDRRELAIRASVVNNGHRPVTITHLGFLFGGDHPVLGQGFSVQPETYEGTPFADLPRLLAEGESLFVDFSSAGLIEIAKLTRTRITALAAYDAQENSYPSKLPADVYRYLNFQILDEDMAALLATRPSSLRRLSDRPSPDG